MKAMTWLGVLALSALPAAPALSQQDNTGPTEPQEQPAQPKQDDAGVPSFTYVFVSGGYEQKRTPDEGQLYKGPGFAGSLNLGSHFFIDADYSLMRSRSFERTGASPSAGSPLPLPGSGSQAPTVAGRLESQAWSVGLGGHAGLARALDLTVSGSYLRNHIVGIDGFSDDVASAGWGAAAGLRYMLFQALELNGGVGYTNMEVPTNGGNNETTQVTSTAPFAGAVLNLNHTWSLGASHSWSKVSRDTALTVRASFDTRKE
jgi:hypothetical protein